MNIERDPFIDKLQKDVLNKLSEISKPSKEEKKLPQNNIKIISPEEAMKELLKFQTCSNT